MNGRSCRAGGAIGDRNNAERDRLNGWKEIAAFFRRDERSVKRWEHQRGLPVRRIPGGSLVFAYKHELEAWLARRQAEPDDAPAEDMGPAVTPPAEPRPLPPKRDPIFDDGRSGR